MNNEIKKLILILISSLFYFSCNIEYIQILKTSSPGLTERKEGWIFENDSIKIDYNFNAKGGVMSFKLFNKLNKPIYLDWKNSSFIYNGEKNNYWIEETNTVGKSVETTIIGKGPLYPYNNRTYALTTGLLSQKSVKAERITFIPPKSGISSSISYYQFRLTNSDIHFKVDPNVADKIMVKALTSNNDKMIRGYIYNYNDTNSIISFRNYLAIAFTENTNQFNFIDNKFFVKSLEEIDIRCLKELPKEGTIFYINGIKKYLSARSRDKN